MDNTQSFIDQNELIQLALQMSEEKKDSISFGISGTRVKNLILVKDETETASVKKKQLGSILIPKVIINGMSYFICRE